MEFNKPLSENDFFAQTFGADALMSTEEDTKPEQSNLIQSIIESDNGNDESGEDSEELETGNEGAQPIAKSSKVESNQEIKEVEDTDVEETVYERAAQLLHKKGFVAKELPEGVEEITSIEDFVAVLEYNQKLKEKEIFENIHTDLDKRLSPFAREILHFDIDSKKNGGDIFDFAKSILYTVEISDLKLDKIEDCLEINKMYFLAKGMEEAEVEDLLDTLQDNPEKLKKQAEINKPKLEELSRKEALKQIEAQNAIKEHEESMQTQLADKLATQLNTLKIGSIGEGLEEFPITSKQAQHLYNSLIGEKYPVPVNGKMVEMSRLEALAHHHRYDERGNINRLLTAMLIMEEPKIVFNHFAKLANTKVVKEAKNQNNFANNTGLVFNKKTKTPETKKADYDIFKQAL